MIFYAMIKKTYVALFIGHFLFHAAKKDMLYLINHQITLNIKYK
jgi:hypothetical protein